MHNTFNLGRTGTAGSAGVVSKTKCASNGAFVWNINAIIKHIHEIDARKPISHVYSDTQRRMCAYLHGNRTCITSWNTKCFSQLSLENGIKIYVAQRKLAVAAYKSNELHPAWYRKTSHHVHIHTYVLRRSADAIVLPYQEWIKPKWMT